jgi:adenylosuccinate lyase
MPFDHDTYLSPLTWRYGSREMRRLWSEAQKRRLMRRVWVALATAQHEAGLVTAAQLAELRAHVDDIDIPRAQVIEKETRHDVMAEIRCYAEQCPTGGAIIHWGATSADINDNVSALRLRAGLALLGRRLEALLRILVSRIEQTAGIPTMAHTHIQPAEPTTLGYRFAFYAQDLLLHWQLVTHLAENIRGKGFKGAVGTQASFADMLRTSDWSPEDLEARAMAVLALPAFPITTQTYPRLQDLRVQQALSALAASLHKLALDFRILQSPPFGEWAEPFAENQVGSSAMPFKRNPINMENVCSLARFVAAATAVAWDNASQAILERSLDDSANRRLYLPESFLAADEMVRRTTNVLERMTIDEGALDRNLGRYGPFAATERVLIALVAAGGDRQQAHGWLREHSLAAWEAVRRGEPNPLVGLVIADERLTALLPADTMRALLTAEAATGTAEARARELAAQIRDQLRAAVDSTT